MDNQGRVEIQSALDINDGGKNNRRCRIYEVMLEQNKTYQIDLMSRNFDALLEVENQQGLQLGRDDDGGQNRDSRLRFRPTQTAIHRLLVGPLVTGEVGAFTLRIETLAEPKEQPLKTIPAGGSVQIDTALNGGDGMHPDRPTRAKVFPFELKKDASYDFTANSPAFPAMLEAFDDAKRSLGSGIGFMRIRPNRDLVVKLWLSSARPQGEGAFKLTAREAIPPPAKVDFPPKQPENFPKKAALPVGGPAEALQFAADRTATAKGRFDRVIPASRLKNYAIQLTQGRTYEVSINTDSGSATAMVMGDINVGAYAIATSKQKAPRRFNVPADDSYRIHVTATNNVGLTAYTLSVRELPDVEPAPKK